MAVKSPIKTAVPEDFSLFAPGLLRRLAAFFYDLLLLLGVFFVATAIILPLNDGQAFNGRQYFYPCYLVGISFLFFGWFWTHGGQTLGLRAWKIKVESVDKQELNWRQAALRFILGLLTGGLDLLLLPFIPSYICCYERFSCTRTVFTNPDFKS